MTGGPGSPRYGRPVERAGGGAPGREPIPPAEHGVAIAESALSDGAKDLLRGVMRLGSTAIFAGGGVGLDYAGLLKTAVRPDIVGRHVDEAAAVLREREVDLILVPGMSGFPIGTMYATAAGIPALLLRKESLHRQRPERTLPPGAFILPSYTSTGEVLMSADPVALLDITDDLFRRQAEAAQGPSIELRLRVAGADDIIDKATMARAASESAQRLGRYALEQFRAAWRHRQNDERPVELTVENVTWATPLLKVYNRPEEHLARVLEGPIVAGLRITGIYTAPRAVGIEGVGVLAFDE
jgi:hypothetical protein